MLSVINKHSRRMNMKKHLVVFFAVLCTITILWAFSPLLAQTDQGSELSTLAPMPTGNAIDNLQTQQSLQTYEEQYNAAKNQYSMSIGVAYDAMLDVLAKPEVAERKASIARNYYEALLKKGFSTEAALQIVIGHGDALSQKSTMMQ
jgi:hypothetical protein